jgi:hypothetical protein
VVEPLYKPPHFCIFLVLLCLLPSTKIHDIFGALQLDIGCHYQLLFTHFLLQDDPCSVMHPFAMPKVEVRLDHPTSMRQCNTLSFKLVPTHQWRIWEMTANLHLTLSPKKTTQVWGVRFTWRIGTMSSVTWIGLHTRHSRRCACLGWYLSPQVILVEIIKMLHKKSIMVVWIKDVEVVLSDEFLSTVSFCLCMGHEEGIQPITNVDKDDDVKWNLVLLLNFNKRTKWVVLRKIHCK